MPGATIWITGLPAAGKTTTALTTAALLTERSFDVVVLDGDELRAAMPTQLGFSREDRGQAVSSAGEVALRHVRQGQIAIVSLVSPYREHRDTVRARHEAEGLTYLEVFMDTPLETCIARDPKGLYRQALAGKLAHMTGIDDPYEAPEAANVRLTPPYTPEQDASLIIAELQRLKLL
jgi:bifunctional enzyme CysN/CysC